MALDALALDFTICLETPDLEHRILELTDHAFGPGRFVKTAERLRENSHVIPDLSFVAMRGETVIGSVRMWPIFVHNFNANTYEPLAFLGPIVVDDAHRGLGIGKALISACVEAAFGKGLRAVLLVGSQSYFKPFGFDKAQNITLPGPVDPNRLLIRYSQPDIAFAGKVCPENAQVI
ncbi:N-acetyltransferase [Asticcacaulis sp.]|uniref:GNAT family N-acetyltransferase n=1 Tax=Asticcacaulis sp. TaxID=1872648 RepID=UPI002BF62839|nr:N-acetyltransferase [Asticcacaulis sp.]HTM83045.1 N-acetyltransferase [Asticcacaulis sp.]